MCLIPVILYTQNLIVLQTRAIRIHVPTAPCVFANLRHAESPVMFFANVTPLPRVGVYGSLITIDTENSLPLREQKAVPPKKQ
jgi:hypothetical protein